MPNGQWLRNTRKRAGFARQEDLAIEMGINRSAIANWETDRAKPTMANAERLAVLLGRSRSEVLAKFGYPIGGGATAFPERATTEWGARDAAATGTAEETVRISLTPEELEAMLGRAADVAVRKLMAELAEGRGG